MDGDKLKISALCASRGNPQGLRTVIGALDSLDSRRHDVTYAVACDGDDSRGTLSEVVCMKQAALNVEYWQSPARPICLGTAWNEAAKTAPAHVYALVTDRSCPITPYWDAYIADAFKRDDTRIVWWTTNAGPVIPIVPHKWVEAAGGKIFTDYFPFWFDDTWLHELSALVHGLPNYLIEASCYIKKRSPVTKRMRDLRFWMDFFIAKRPERIEHAVKIREALGVKKPNMKPVEEWFKSNDEMWTSSWKTWEEAMGDKSEPDETYLAAKKAAEEMMSGN